MSSYKAVDWSTIKLFWQAALTEKRLLLLSSMFPIGAILMSTVAPLIIGKAIASLATPGGDPLAYVPYFVGAAVLGVAGNRFGLPRFLQLQAKVMSYLQAKALDTLLKRSVGFHNNNVGGKLVSDAIDFPGAFALLTNAIFIQMVPLTLVLLAGTTLVFVESWQLGLVILTMSAYAVISGIRESLKRKPIRQRRLIATKAVTAHLADTILNVQTVKTFAREQAERRQHDKLNHELRRQRLSDWTTAALHGNNRMIVLVFMQLAFVLFTVRLLQNDPSLLGIGIFAFSFTVMISNRLFEVNAMMRTVEDGLLQASPMTEIIQESVEIHDKPGAPALKTTKGALHLDAVDFRYPDSSDDQTVFTGLTLDIAPGEKIGLVGPSGGGKSTLTRLLLRFEDITGGSITIDRQNIAEVTQASLRQAISYVPQEPLLFHRPISENIAYGKPDATKAMIVAAAKQANAHDFITDLPNGYDTLVGERGVKLSGGQRQRVAIARAILKDAPILVLDEATSALDSESELLIQDALRKLMKGRTTIVIAHRLSTIQKMDRIVVLENGMITEQGTHKELLSKKGVYAKLWKHQSGGFLEE